MPEKPLSALEAMVGEQRRTVEGLRVEAGKVEEFARAFRDEDPLYRSESTADDRGFDAVPAPLTFTRTAAFPRYRPEGVDDMPGFDLGFRKEYAVHGEQAYEYERPLVVGDVLSGVTTLADVFQRNGRRGGTLTFAIYETEFRDRSDDPVVTARSTLIETGGAIEDGGTDEDDEVGDGGEYDEAGDGAANSDRVDDGDHAGDDVQSPDSGAGPATVADGAPEPTAETVAVGDSGPALVVEDVQRPDFVKYAGASGDFTPIHYDEPYVRAAGHEQVFAQGMLTAGYVARVAVDWFGLGAISRFETQFRAQLFPGDDVLVTGTVTDVTETDAGATVVASLEATTRDGTVVVAGETEATVPPA